MSNPEFDPQCGECIRIARIRELLDELRQIRSNIRSTGNSCGDAGRALQICVKYIDAIEDVIYPLNLNPSAIPGDDQ